MKKLVLLFAVAVMFVGSIGEGGKNRTALIKTNMGDMRVTLFEDKAPITTKNFISLAESGFYDGLTFHRIIKGFMIQGGDPKGDGSGGTGKTIPLEIHKELTHVDGALSMARSNDPDSASCQFFICDGPQHGLDGNYAVFGKVVEGRDVLRKIAGVPTGANDRPLKPVVIESIKIE